MPCLWLNGKKSKQVEIHTSHLPAISLRAFSLILLFLCHHLFCKSLQSSKEITTPAELSPWVATPCWIVKSGEIHLQPSSGAKKELAFRLAIGSSSWTTVLSPSTALLWVPAPLHCVVVLYLINKGVPDYSALQEWGQTFNPLLLLRLTTVVLIQTRIRLKLLWRKSPVGLLFSLVVEKPESTY